MKHGYTEGCPQCDHIERVGNPRPGGQHSNICRDRVIEAIGGTEAGEARLAERAERLDRAMVEFSHPDGAARDVVRPPAEAEFQDTREVSGAHATWLATRREPLQPGRSGTSSSRGTGTENAADLYGRLGLETAATEAMTARPNAQGPGTLCASIRLLLGRLQKSSPPAMRWKRVRQADDEKAMDMGPRAASSPERTTS